MWFNDKDGKYHLKASSHRRYYLYGYSTVEWQRACDPYFSSSIDKKYARAHQVASDTVEAAMLLAKETVCHECWAYELKRRVWEEEAQAARHEQEEIGRARDKRRAEWVRQREEAKQESIQVYNAMIAAKIAEGKAQVKPRHLITLLNLETNECDKVYLVRGNVSTTRGRTAWEPFDRVPRLPSNTQQVYTGTPFGKSLNGLFVGDEFTINAPDGEIAYSVVDVQPLVALSNETEAAKNERSEEQPIYEGKGRNGGTHTVGLDGSKYIGHMERDGGQWGSFPTHDDYGDESDAEGNDETRWVDLSGE